LLIGICILAFAFAEGVGNDWISVDRPDQPAPDDDDAPQSSGGRGSSVTGAGDSGLTAHVASAPSITSVHTFDSIQSLDE
jgi:hypothetical protein